MHSRAAEQDPQQARPIRTQGRLSRRLGLSKNNSGAILQESLYHVPLGGTTCRVNDGLGEDHEADRVKCPVALFAAFPLCVAPATCARPLPAISLILGSHVLPSTSTTAPVRLAVVPHLPHHLTLTANGGKTNSSLLQSSTSPVRFISKFLYSHGLY